MEVVESNDSIASPLAVTMKPLLLKISDAVTVTASAQAGASARVLASASTSTS